MIKNIENGKLLKLCNVLHVSDNTAESKVMQAFLSLHVKKTYVATSVEEGLKSFNYYKPDIVILDLKISHEANIKLLKEIRNIDEKSIVLLIATSSKSDFFINAIELNVNGFLLKPVADDRLLHILKESAILIRSEAQEKYYENFEQKIIDKQSNMIMILDESFKIQRANSRFLTTFEVDSIEDFNKKYIYKDIVLDCKIYHDFLDKLDIDTIVDIVNNPDNKYVVTIMDLPNYNVKAFLVNGTRERTDLGDVEYIIAFADVTAYEVEKRKIEKSVYLDPLTNIHNRHIFEELFKHELNMKKRYSQPSSIIFFDIDDFKNINDEYGHNVGDEVLKSVVKFFKKKIRTVDTFIRWGGEEFIVFLPYTDKKESIDLADRLKQSLSQIVFDHDIRITCSFGVSVLQSDDTYQSFIERADRAQYKSKTEGKNRVTYM